MARIRGAAAGEAATAKGEIFLLPSSFWTFFSRRRPILLLSEPTPYVARMAETLSITDSIKIERDHGSQSGEYRFDVCLRTRAEFDCDMLIVALPQEVMIMLF